MNAVKPGGIFSVDVEDWFHILGLPAAPDLERWSTLPGHVETNFRRMLDVIEAHDVRVTCFVLGWVAERYPQLVKDARARGHEISSHGYAHQLAYTQTPQAFLEDVRRTKHLLEDLAGTKVAGYRCPGFSVTEATPWFFEKLVEAGYEYDSSVFPARRQHGGLRTGALAPHVVSTPAGPLVEFPITVTRVLGAPMCFFGGGYLRLFPYALVRRMSERVAREGRPVVFYVHPREIDPTHPRLPMSRLRRFKSYVGLRSTEGKIRKILDEFELTTFRDYLAQNRHLGATS